ncbi:MAG: DUF2254 domain-containing protein [Alphaproteobacteria bacterium]|nr:MAG: DUF2254 domain-containing protein [Alphaproteobacteria bacterium]
MKGFAGFPAVAALARLRDKYWFLPAMSAFVGLVAGIAMVALDIAVGSDWLGRFDTLHGSRPEGARAMLSTIAGSTITVAGVVFSITLAAVTYASGQHGPRLLTNFARDRGNQLTLGVFVGTYVYCLIVLRTIRSAGEEGQAPAFVPQIAVYGALLLALASIAVLIYFFHHVTETIHINNVVARIGRKLIHTLHEQDQEKAGADPVKMVERKIGTLEADVRAARPGYVETIDHSELSELATEHGAYIRLRCRPGDFVQIGTPLLTVVSGNALPPKASGALRAALTIGDRRTDLQDLRFGFDELTEIAIRALSPGINDPFTAIACIDWLSAALLECEKSIAPAVAEAPGLAPLVQTLPLTFSDFVAVTFGRMRQHAATEGSVKAAALAALTGLAANATSPADTSVLLVEAAQLERVEP